MNNSVGSVSQSFPEFTIQNGLSILPASTAGGGGAIAANRSGDMLSYNASMATEDSGMQPALMAHLQSSDETLLQYGNGETKVSNSSGNTLSAIHGQLVGERPHGAGLVQLGSVNDPESWKQAVSQGFASQQGAQDLMTMQHSGLAGVASVQQKFGVGHDGATSSASVEQLTTLLQDKDSQSAPNQFSSAQIAASQGNYGPYRATGAAPAA